MRCAVVFEAADPPRNATMAFWSPDGHELPSGVGCPAELDVVVPHGGVLRQRTVPALRVPVGTAVPVLSRTKGAHPAAAFWGAATVVALQLIARGRLLPGVSDQGFDAWRIGPLDADDVERIRALAAAMPPSARAVPVPGRVAAELPDPERLVRDFLDAVADVIPRAPAARTAGSPVFAAVEPQRVTQLRDWATEVAAGLDSGVRISLRLEMPDDGFFWALVQVHSLADPTLMTDARELWAGTSRGFGPQARTDTVLAVRRAARAWPVLQRLLDAAVPDELILDDTEVGELLCDGAERLAGAGVAVHWPRELARELTAQAIIRAPTGPRAEVPAFFNGDELLHVDWELALRGEPLTRAELDLLAQAHRPIVRLRGQWTLVDPALARKARERALAPRPVIEAVSAALTGTIEADGKPVEVAASSWLTELRERLADPDGGGEPVRQPAALAAPLRDYQLRGLRWLSRMTSLGLGGCLADDMGLGKTIMVIALHLHRQAGPTLVVCPASVLGNWQREIERFAPGTPVRRFHGSGRSLARLSKGFVLTTYPTMRLDADVLGSRRWDLVVADEAQHVKNPLSGTAKALRTIPAGVRIALTGTPVENSLSDLWAILDWTTPGLLGSLSSFRTRWAGPIEADRNPETAERFSRLVAPFLLRRRKSDPTVAPELPLKTETDHPVGLTHEQAALYQAVVCETMTQIRSSSGMARRGLILKLLTALKQICNHPAQYLGESRYLKETRLRLAGRSEKLDLLDDLVDTVVAEDGAILVFTQYVTMARLIERHLGDRGVPVQLLHGGIPVRRRDLMVQRFQSGEVPVFLLSLKAGGTGLNLTHADHVVHYDRWWNPAVEEQATDRSYRIGQTRPVQVHRLIAEGTIEDHIATLLQSKRKLADAVLRGGEVALSELSDTELAKLVELRSPQ
ncbi:MAG TPA: DEAD/DEAH box helicase [Pseudonocardiaceae bacterium]|nr:DEAD/DEAH box helicase [Pseudonocardiaceae bacterium]